MTETKVEETGTSGARLDVAGLRLRFSGRGEPARALLEGGALQLPAGTALALMGPSGSGKTSLLHALAGLERPDGGTVCWDGQDLWRMAERARDDWRRRRLGLVFQDFHLLDGMTAAENVLLPARFDSMRLLPETRKRAQALLKDVGLHEPGAQVGRMSRGERQRVALARALLRQPGVILADEPTASLDSEAGQRVTALLLAAATAAGATLIVATHDPALAAQMPLRAAIRDGRLEMLV